MKAVKYLIAAIVIFLSSSSYAQYTGTSINNLNTSTPTENGSFMYEYNDAIREIKTVLKNQYAIGSKTANYTTTASDSIIHIRSGTWTISLGTPTAYSSVGHTKSFIIKNTGTQTASVSPGSKKIEGTTTALSLASSSSVYLWTDGNDWYKLKADTATIADNATNADQLDNQDSTYYTNATNLATGTVALGRLPGTLTGKSADYLDDLDSTHFTNASNLDSGTIPLARIPSTLTGKDADTLDTLDSTNFLLTTGSYIGTWRVGNTAGTGTLGLAAGIGISLIPTYDSNGKGTVTVTAVGTATAGGWVDTGTQTVSTDGYPVNCQGTVTIKSGNGYGIISPYGSIATLSSSSGTITNLYVQGTITATNLTLTNQSFSYGTWTFKNTNTVFTVPNGISMVYVTVVGGGGGGGARSGIYNIGGGGGGAGGGYIDYPIVVTQGATMTVVIGTGGTGGAAGSAGSNGGTSTVSIPGSTTALLIADYGRGGSSGSNSSNPGGSGGNSTESYGGFAGQSGSAGDESQGGNGGGNFFGRMRAGPTSGGGSDAMPYSWGCGGSGARTGNGGAGNAGFVLIKY